MKENLRLENCVQATRESFKCKRMKFQTYSSTRCPKPAILVLQDFGLAKSFICIAVEWLTFENLFDVSPMWKQLDVPHLGENSFLITIFFLSGCSTCTPWFVPKCQNVFPSSHNVHLKIKIKDVHGKFECEPNTVYKGYISTGIWLTNHSIDSYSVVKPFF